MLFWICPECGRECSPAVRECPACTGEAEAGSLSVSSVQHRSSQNDGILALAKIVEAPPSSRRLLAPPPAQQFHTANGHSIPATNTAALTDTESSAAPIETHAAPANETIDLLVRPLVESANEGPAIPAAREGTQPTEAASGDVSPQITDETPASVAVETATPVEAALESPSGNVVGQITDATPASVVTETAPLVETAIEAPSAELVPASPDLMPISAATETAPLVETAAELPIAEVTQLTTETVPPVETAPESPSAEVVSASADATPISAATETAPPAEPSPVPQAEEAKPVSEAKNQAEPQAEPQPQTTARDYTDALEVHAQTILDAVHAQLEEEQSRIRAVVESLQEQPKTSLLSPPAEVVTAPAPPVFEWIRIPRPTIAPRAPKRSSLASVLSGPQVSTLAGPSLPAELHNLLEQRTTSRRRHRKSLSIPGWIWSVLLAIALFLGTGAALQYFNATRDAKAAVLPAQTSQPLEVTGLRIVSASGHKQQIQYIVVNHSAAELSRTTVQFVVRSLETNAGTALFSVNAEIPSLGPYQSKEVRTDLDADLHSIAVPDWQYLRADILAGGR